MFNQEITNEQMNRMIPWTAAVVLILLILWICSILIQINPWLFLQLLLEFIICIAGAYTFILAILLMVGIIQLSYDKFQIGKNK